MKTSPFLSIFLACSLIGILSGCFQAKSGQQYTLSSPPSIQALPQQDTPMTILIGPVKVASYLDQPRMVKRYGASRIDTIAGREWAGGDLAEMISNQLVADMASLLKPSPVYPYPVTIAGAKGRRAAIDILRFEGSEDKTATIEARWFLFDLQDKSIIKVQSSLFHVPLADGSYETLATALSQGLALLSREIAETAISSKEVNRAENPRTKE
ncbi:MAG: PqiC family protein [Proteobacteria bacterium]|nr:PqiC family protein [Pseudomonadota bacterium]MBU1650127.1 PqiC family protein [Pseudomonadota bacterium]